MAYSIKINETKKGKEDYFDLWSLYDVISLADKI